VVCRQISFVSLIKILRLQLNLRRINARCNYGRPNDIYLAAFLSYQPVRLCGKRTNAASSGELRTRIEKSWRPTYSGPDSPIGLSLFQVAAKAN
jgi:hypothetical protein